MRRSWMGVAVIAALVTTGIAAPAVVASSTGAAVSPPVNVLVLTPPGYDAARWPVMYVLNSGCASPCTPDSLPASLQQLRGRPWISVIDTDARGLADYAERADGAPNPLKDYPLSLATWADQNLRTVPGPATRTLVGLSAGGYGALLTASRHPGLFGTVVGISAPADLRANNDAFEPVFFETNSSPPLGDIGAFGRPLVDDPTWALNNPGDLAADLAHTRLFFGSGTGIPCGSDESSFFPGIENLVRQSQIAYTAELTAAGVPFTWDEQACGAHDDQTFTRELAQWLARYEPFGASNTPSMFVQLDWSRDVTAYGWHVAVDPARAFEPLRLAVDGRRAQLTGTGRATLTTPPNFCGDEPGGAEFDGRSQTWSRAADGSLTTAVDLGSADTTQALGPYGPPGSIAVPGRSVQVKLPCAGR